MEYFSKFFSNFKEYYQGINGATLTGAIDVIVVQQQDSTFISSPFHVRFGKLGVLRSREKVVDIEINGEAVDIQMKLGESGEAFFVSGSSLEDEEIPAYLATSPIPPSGDESRDHSRGDTPEDPASVNSTPCGSLVENQDGRLVTSSTSNGAIPGFTTVEDQVADRKTLLSTLKPNETLMGSRDGGLLASSSSTDIVLAPTPPELKIFKAETITCGTFEGSFKPINPDGAKMNEKADEPVVEMTEEERKRWNKKRRKKRSQMRKRQLKEVSKNSSESGTDVIEDIDEVDVPLIETTNMVANQVGSQCLHASDSVSGIEVYLDEPSSPTLESHLGNNLMSFGPQFHFFSDTEIDLGNSDTSRPTSPVHSDTEYERRMSSANESLKETQQSWRWGELPSLPVTRSSPSKPSSHNSSRDPSSSDLAALASNSADDDKDGGRTDQSSQQEVQRSMLSHMFSFMRQTKKIRNKAAATGGGIYLDDLNSEALDPELAALYFPPSHFRQSHNSAPGNYQARSLHKDEDNESGNGQSLPQSPHSLLTTGINTSRGPHSVDSDFEDSRHDYRHFPEIFLSLCGNLKDLPEPPEDLFLQSLITYDDFVENPRLIENPDLVVRIGNKYYTWAAACPIIMSWVLYQRPLPQTAVDVLVQEFMSKRQEDKKKPTREASSYSWFPWRRSESKKISTEEKVAVQGTKTIETVTRTESSNSLLQPLPQTESSTEVTVTENDNDWTNVDGAKNVQNEKRPYYDNMEKCRKTLRLSSEQIAKLHLREGPNEAVFSVTTAYQGTTRCKCHIYLWRHDDKVVISDIDGTITKSDVLGHILPIVGQDWAQSGVAQLFTKIKNNGYRILYLSARAIGQARITRDYLRSVRQGDLSLPDGPLLLNPTSLLSALHREVIEKKPEDFKISCLRDIRALFPSNPFYAGYGNKVNDVWAYGAVGIPISRIFTINSRGELKHELTQTFQSSYSKQSSNVDLFFPPLDGARPEALEDADFSDFNYWKEPIADLPDDALQFSVAYHSVSSSRSRRASRIDQR